MGVGGKVNIAWKGGPLSWDKRSQKARFEPEQVKPFCRVIHVRQSIFIAKDNILRMQGYNDSLTKILVGTPVI